MRAGGVVNQLLEGPKSGTAWRASSHNAKHMPNRVGSNGPCDSQISASTWISGNRCSAAHDRRPLGTRDGPITDSHRGRLTSPQQTLAVSGAHLRDRAAPSDDGCPSSASSTRIKRSAERGSARKNRTISADASGPAHGCPLDVAPLPTVAGPWPAGDPSRRRAAHVHDNRTRRGWPAWGGQSGGTRSRMEDQ